MYANIRIDHDWIKRFLKMINPNLEEQIAQKLPKYTDYYHGTEAIRHLCQVASSVDSLVIGEREIFRQFREAYQFCSDAGLCGDFLRLIEKHVVTTAKSVYTRTKIGERPISVASLAFKKLLASNISNTAQVLMIGAGETNTNIARFLSKHRFENVTVFNRSLHTTGEVSKLLNTEALHLTDLKSYTRGFDAIIICTASTKPIIDISLYRSLLNKDVSKKVLVDLSVPRNIDPLIVEQFDVEYIDVESIRSLAEANMAFRKQELVSANVIIDENLDAFEELLQERRLELSLKSIPSEIKAVKDRAVNQVFKSDIENLDTNTRELVLKMMDYMEKKCIAAPIKIARETQLN